MFPDVPLDSIRLRLVDLSITHNSADNCDSPFTDHEFAIFHFKTKVSKLIAFGKNFGVASFN